MTEKEFLKDLAKLGFPLMEVEERFDVNMTIAQVVKSHDVRLWEGFPLLLANSQKSGMFDSSVVFKYLDTKRAKEDFKSLVFSTTVFLKAVKMKFLWEKALLKAVGFSQAEAAEAYKEFVREKTGKLYGGMSLERMKKLFENYQKKQNRDLDELLAVKEEFNLEFAFAQVFSPKQKELFLKKLHQEKLTKTEKEYFSRVVKKKVMALANEELHRLARKALM